jgi:hypothetical protein
MSVPSYITYELTPNSWFLLSIMHMQSLETKDLTM